jgi:hypothetical protein
MLLPIVIGVDDNAEQRSLTLSTTYEKYRIRIRNCTLGLAPNGFVLAAWEMALDSPVLI